MRCVEVLSVNEIDKAKIVSTTPFEDAVSKRSLTITYSGGEVGYINGKTCVKQICDMVPPVGYDLLFLPVPGFKPIHPALVSADIWFGEVVLSFINNEYPELGDPIAMVMAIPRAETKSRQMTVTELEEYDNKLQELKRDRSKISTRVIDHEGFVVDNAYEVMTKNSRPVGSYAFFRRATK